MLQLMLAHRYQSVLMVINTIPNIVVCTQSFMKHIDKYVCNILRTCRFQMLMMSKIGSLTYTVCHIIYISNGWLLII